MHTCTVLKVNNMRLLSIGQKNCISYSKGKLYIHTNPEDKPELIGVIPYKKGIYRLFVKFRLFERLLRLEPRMAIEVDRDIFLVSCSGMIINVNVKDCSVLIEHEYRKFIHNPMSFCKVSGLSCFPDCVMYGEYYQNKERNEVNMYARVDKKWIFVNKFDKGSIKHIHGIFVDTYRDQLVIATGDDNKESGLWSLKTFDGKIEPIILGSQIVRSCFVVPTKQGLVYVTDTPLEKNWIYMCKQGPDGQYKTEVITTVPGPCTYGILSKHGLENFVISTTVEGDCRLPMWRFIFTRKHAPGVSDIFSHILHFKDGAITELIKFKKDWLPMTLFQPGNIMFPTDERKDYGDIYIVPYSTYKSDNCTYVIKI